MNSFVIGVVLAFEDAEPPTHPRPPDSNPSRNIIRAGFFTIRLLLLPPRANLYGHDGKGPAENSFVTSAIYRVRQRSARVPCAYSHGKRTSQSSRSMDRLLRERRCLLWLLYLRRGRLPIQPRTLLESTLVRFHLQPSGWRRLPFSLCRTSRSWILGMPCL